LENFINRTVIDAALRKRFIVEHSRFDNDIFSKETRNENHGKTLAY